MSSTKLYSNRCYVSNDIIIVLVATKALICCLFLTFIYTIFLCLEDVRFLFIV